MFFKKHKINPPEIVIEQQDSKKLVSRIEKAFDEQREEMYMRGLNAHDAGCDIFKCGDCFERIPDKIVSEPYQIPLIERRIKPENYEAYMLVRIVNKIDQSQLDT